MIAGILLGPWLRGFVAPGAASALFPEESLPYLDAVSQLGVVSSCSSWASRSSPSFSAAVVASLPRAL
jgi:hypothetical protein